MRGYWIDSPPSDIYSDPFGSLFTITTTTNGVTTTTPYWSYGMNKTVTSGTSSNDFFLKSYNVTSLSPAAPGQLLNIRSDNGQMTIGPGATTNTGIRQVELHAGTTTAPKSGLAITTYNSDYVPLVLLQSGSAPTNRVEINMDNIFRAGTDYANNSGQNYFVCDTTSGNPATWRYPFTISALGNQTDALTLGVNGNDQIGFYGSAGTTKPVITGCRSDGTALANLLQKLQAMGLITDQTTP